MGPRVSETGTLTGVALAIIALLAVLTIVAIVAGARKKRARAEAERVERERVADAGGVPADDGRVLTDEDATDRAGIASRDAAEEPAPPPPAADDPAPVADVADERPLADEPVAASAPLDAAPAVEAQPPAPPVPAAPRESRAEAPVTQLKGLGPKVATLLGQHGIVTIGDLAALDARAAEDLDARLGAFTGRMARDRWIEQARLLAEGDVATYEDRFGKL